MTGQTAPRYEHGTRARYNLDHCHCDECRQANREYEANRVRQHLYGRSRWCYDLDPIRDHLAQLRAAGYGTRTIADLAGVRRQAIQAIVTGMSRGRARKKQPAVRILNTTADAILAIDIPDTDPIDQVAVQRVLDGQPPARLTRAERLEVVRLWMTDGRTQKDLERLTGWDIQHNVRTLRNEGVLP